MGFPNVLAGERCSCGMRRARRPRDSDVSHAERSRVGHAVTSSVGAIVRQPLPLGAAHLTCPARSSDTDVRMGVAETRVVGGRWQ